MEQNNSKRFSLEEEVGIQYNNMNVWINDSLDDFTAELKRSNPHLENLITTVDSFGVTLAFQLKTSVQQHMDTDSLVSDIRRTFDFSELKFPEHCDSNIEAVIYIFPEANSINKEMEVLKLEIRPKSELEYYLVSIYKTNITGIDTISLNK